MQLHQRINKVSAQQTLKGEGTPLTLAV